MKVTRSQLKRIIQEELQEDSDFVNPNDPSGHTPFPPQKKSAPRMSIDSAISEIIHSKFKMLYTKDAKALKKILKIAIANVIENFQPTTPLQEKAPPGKEDMVMALKKKMCGGKDDCPEAFATAWKSHNKE